MHSISMRLTNKNFFINLAFWGLIVTTQHPWARVVTKRLSASTKAAG